MAGKKDEFTYGWWGERFQQYALAEILLLPSYDMPSPGRMSSARKVAARIGVERGKLTAVVASGQYGHHTAQLKVKPLTQREWRQALDAIAADPETAHRLLAGTPGPELERQLAAADVALFPAPAQLEPFRCSCHADQDCCRHELALVLQTAALLDQNPFAWLQVLGKERAEVLAAVRARLADKGEAPLAGSVGASGEVAATSPALSAELFWETGVDPANIAVRPGESAAPDALLRRLGPLPLPAGSQQVTVEVLRPWPKAPDQFYRDTELRSAEGILRDYVTGVGQGAQQLARGEITPTYAAEDVPGKAIPLRERLGPEIEQAVAQEEGVVPLRQLWKLCPTAAALPEEAAMKPLVDAVEELQPRLVVLARHYVAEPESVLTGAHFRHVIAFDEWYAGHLLPGTDWELLLRGLGLNVEQYTVEVDGHLFPVPGPQRRRPGEEAATLFGYLQPEIGDELQLTLVDPSQPLLAARLVRRHERDRAERLAASRIAAGAICDHMVRESRLRMTHVEAVQLLLAEGFYTERRAPDPVWLLSAVEGSNLYQESPDVLTLQNWRAAGPRFGRSHGYWPAAFVVIKEFLRTLQARGESAEAVAATQRCVDAWVAANPADQTDVHRPVALAALLHFLWSEPHLPFRLRVKLDAAPQSLAAWFLYLADRFPWLAAPYAPHVMACSLTGLFRERSLSYPQHELPDSWVLEGYRWMGPRCYFA